MDDTIIYVRLLVVIFCSNILDGASSKYVLDAGAKKVILHSSLNMASLFFNLFLYNIIPLHPWKMNRSGDEHRLIKWAYLIKGILNYSCFFAGILRGVLRFKVYALQSHQLPSWIINNKSSVYCYCWCATKVAEEEKIRSYSGLLLAASCRWQ